MVMTADFRSIQAVTQDSSSITIASRALALKTIGEIVGRPLHTLDTTDTIDVSGRNPLVPVNTHNLASMAAAVSCCFAPGPE